MTEKNEIIDREELTIISQNLFNYRKKNRKGKKQIDFYINNYKADIYAFQEFPEWGRGKTFYTTFYNNKEDKGFVEKIEKLWKRYYPWTDFPKRYWSEKEISFCGKCITIINLHISNSYDDQLRFILLKRLEQLKNELVVIVGDFNAAFSYQTDNVIIGNNVFLSLIIKKGYVEMCDKCENIDNPHYTFALFSSSTNLWEKKKLDHIFCSQGIFKMGWEIDADYIDDVNVHLEHINGNKPQNPFTDHTGIKLFIRNSRI